jgi:hypothetical protein
MLHCILYVIYNVVKREEVGRRESISFQTRLERFEFVAHVFPQMLSFNFPYLVGLNIRSISDMYICILTYFQSSITVTSSLCAYPILHIYIAAMLVLLIKINSKAPIWFVIMWLLVQTAFLENCLINLYLTLVIEPGLRLTDKIS